VYRIGLSLREPGLSLTGVGSAAFRDGPAQVGLCRGSKTFADRANAMPPGHSERLPRAGRGAPSVSRSTSWSSMVRGSSRKKKASPALIPNRFHGRPRSRSRGALSRAWRRPRREHHRAFRDVHADFGPPKRLELLKEGSSPSASLVAVFFDPGSSEALPPIGGLSQATPPRSTGPGRSLSGGEVKGPEPFRHRARLCHDREGAPHRGSGSSLPKPAIASHRKNGSQRFAMKNRLPVIGTVRRWAGRWVF